MPSTVGAVGISVAATFWSYLILAIVMAVFVWLPAKIAIGKGRNPWLWGALGFVFPLITLVVILVLPSTTPPAATAVDQPE